MVNIITNQPVKTAQLETLSKEAQSQIRTALGGENAELLAQLELLAAKIAKKRKSGTVNVNDVKSAINSLGVVKPDQIEKIARSILLSATIFHGMNDFQKSEAKTPIEDQIEADIRSLVLKSQNPLETLQRLGETIRITIQRQTHTYHPVVYQTKTARNFLQDVTTTLQGAKQDQHGIVSMAIDTVREKISALIGLVMGENISLTPQVKIGIGTEGEYEVENVRAMRNNLTNFHIAWNKVVDKLMQDEEFLWLVSNESSTNRGEVINAMENIHITEADRKRSWRLSTWGGRIPSADSDGRREATSHALSRSIYGGCELIDGKLYFKDVAHDLRIASNVAQDTVGALVRRAYLRSRGKTAKEGSPTTIPSVDGGKFAAFGNAFVTTAFKDGEEKVHGNADWSSKNASKDYLYQELPAEKRAEFSRAILLNNDLELVPDEIKNIDNGYVVRFNEAYRAILKKHNMENVGFGSIDINTQQLISDDLADEGFSLTPDGRGYDVLKGGKDASGRPLLLKGFLSGSRVLDKNGKQKPVDDNQATTLTDAMRRFIVMNEALTKVEDGRIICEGEPIADRCQMANFSSKANFYEMMIMFKESGLLEMDGLNVTKVKMGIQPLIETIKDMRHAPEIFRELLKDPVVLSYYKTRGVAEFMIGFSDGAKSAGNLGSEWALYNVQRELYKVFMEHKQELGPDFKIIFFEGRGRRENRGGSIDSELSAEMTPDELAIQGIRDETIQGDHAGEAFSNPEFGIRDVYGRFIGTAKARERALTTTAEEKAELKKHEDVIDFLADFSATVFAHKVSKNKKIEVFIDNMPFNGNISSRASDRPDSAVEGYDAKRAVPVEAMGADADLPFHYVGMGEAITCFNFGKTATIKEYDDDTKEWVVLKTYDLQKFGDPAERKESLSQVSKHPFMKAFLKRAEVGLANFHPEIAALYGDDITGGKEFVDEAIGSLQNLKNKITLLKPKTITSQTSQSRQKGGEHASHVRNESSRKSSMSSNADIFDIIGHILMGLLKKNNPNLSKLDPREHPDTYRALNDVLAVSFDKYSEAELEPQATHAR